MEDSTSVSTRRAASEATVQHWNCSDVDWDAVSAVSATGAAVALLIILVSLPLQYYLSWKFRIRPLLTKIQSLTLLGCGLPLIPYLVIVYPRKDGNLLTTEACVGLGSVFYVLLLSTFFWLASEHLIALKCASRLNSVQPPHINLSLLTIVNYGVPILLMLIVNFASSVSKPLFGSSFYIADDNFQINRQFCWLQDRTALIVAMLVPALGLIVIAVAAGIKVHLVCLQSECTQLFYLPVWRVVLAPAFGTAWLMAALGNGHLQTSRNCDSALAFNSTFCGLAVVVFLLMAVLYAQASLAVRKLREHEQQAGDSLVFIKQRPIVLGSDGFSTGTEGTTITATTVVSSGSTTSSASGWLLGRKRDKDRQRTSATFNEVLSMKDRLPSQFTVRPGSTGNITNNNLIGSNSSLKKPSQATLPRVQVTEAEGITDGVPAATSLPEAVLDKSRSAVDMTQGLHLDDPLRSNGSLPNIDMMLRKERQLAMPSIRSEDIPIPQEVEEEEMTKGQMRDYGLDNQSFDELEETDDDRSKLVGRKAQAAACGTHTDVNKPYVYPGPDGQSTPDEKSPTSIEGAANFERRSASEIVRRSSGRQSKKSSHVLAQSEQIAKKKSSTLPQKGRKPPKAGDPPLPLPRGESWQSSEVDSSEMDTLPRTRSLPGHKRSAVQAQAEVVARRGKPSKTRKSFQDEADDERVSPQGYLYSHMGSLPDIDEMPSSAAADIQKDRSKTFAGAPPGRKMSVKSSSAPSIGEPTEKKVSADGKTDKKKHMQHHSQFGHHDNRSYYPPPGYGGPDPYGHQSYGYGYGQYYPGYGQPPYGPPPYGPPPGPAPSQYGHPQYNPNYYNSPYGGLPYGYQQPGHPGQQQPPGKKVKFSTPGKKATKKSPSQDSMENTVVYAEIDRTTRTVKHTSVPPGKTSSKR